MTWTENAYAKLNLALDILGRRPDGYHDMRMVMQSIDLADRVSVAPQAEPGVSVNTDLPYLPRGEGNIAAKAAARFFEETGLPFPGLAIDIQKQIPVCAGMAGGSSDGAAVLRVLRRVYAPDLPWERLEESAAAVGSDVPFCVRGGTALAEGRGEVLTDLPPLPDCRFVLCKPDFDLPTGPMFARLRFDGDLPHPDVDGMAAALERGDLAGTATRVGNLFEAVLEPAERREIDGIKELLLRHGALAAAMSGSGPAVFGIFALNAETAGAEEELKRRYAQVFLARPVRRLL